MLTAAMVNDVLAWSDDLKLVEIDLFSKRVGPRMENMALDYQSEPIQFVSLFFYDLLIEQIA